MLSSSLPFGLVPDAPAKKPCAVIGAPAVIGQTPEGAAASKRRRVEAPEASAVVAEVSGDADRDASENVPEESEWTSEESEHGDPEGFDDPEVADDENMPPEADATSADITLNVHQRLEEVRAREE